MAIIQQGTPLYDNVTVELSSVYQNHLSMVAASGAVAYITTLFSSELLVEPNGEVATTGQLYEGTYLISGTCSDSGGNNGTWTFSLTVTGPFTPQASITPLISDIPTANGMEIAVPFQIDPATGAVAVLTSYAAILAQHIETIVMTMLGERLMLPRYGSGAQNALFDPIGSARLSFLIPDIKTAIQTQEPAVKVLSISVETNQPQAETTLSVVITWSVVPYNDVNVLTVAAGGSVIQASSQ